MLNFCPKCGNKLYGDKFCANCGADLSKYGEGAFTPESTDANSAIDDMIGNVMGYASEQQEKERKYQEEIIEQARAVLNIDPLDDGTYIVTGVKDNSIKKVTIPYGVTKIAACTFSCCRSLLSVNIPYGVISIGNHAFSECDLLQSITIPEGVISIGEGAFDNCESLISVVFPDTVKSIGHNAFAGCNSLKSVTIPKDCDCSESWTFPNDCKVIRR